MDAPAQLTYDAAMRELHEARQHLAGIWENCLSLLDRRHPTNGITFLGEVLSMASCGQHISTEACRVCTRLADIHEGPREEAAGEAVAE